MVIPNVHHQEHGRHEANSGKVVAHRVEEGFGEVDDGERIRVHEGHEAGFETDRTDRDPRLSMPLGWRQVRCGGFETNTARLKMLYFVDYVEV